MGPHSPLSSALHLEPCPLNSTFTHPFFRESETMTDKMRWRYGDTNPVVAVGGQATTVIEIGDLLWQDTDNAKPAALLARQRQRDGQPGGIRPASSWAWPWQRSRRANRPRCAWRPPACSSWIAASETFELGDLVGAERRRRSQRACMNQQVVKVGSSQLAIGRVAKRQPVGHDQRAGRHPLDRHDRRRRRRRQLQRR